MQILRSTFIFDILTVLRKELIYLGCLNTKMSTVQKVRITKVDGIYGDDNSRVTYRAIIDSSRDRHFFAVDKDCGICETWDGILFKTRKHLKQKEKVSCVSMECCLVM